jgi:hypothetical protein
MDMRDRQRLLRTVSVSLYIAGALLLLLGTVIKYMWGI